MIMSFFFSNGYYLDSMPRCYDTCVIFETRVVSDEICLNVSHDICLKYVLMLAMILNVLMLAMIIKIRYVMFNV